MFRRRQFLFNVLSVTGSSLFGLSFLDRSNSVVGSYVQTLVIQKSGHVDSFQSPDQFLKELNSQFLHTGLFFHYLERSRKNGKIVQEHKTMMNSSTLKFERVWRTRFDYLAWRFSDDRKDLQNFLESSTQYSIIS
ncbi:MAG: hypothetical protein HRT44_04295 [Bdellovibrionales bacterium]|nr:hypothetical protein [Bdellovibrionales bacterium]NQZ18464.1 hypothetical protein [Bdellovibrionales bacterium]